MIPIAFCENCQENMPVIMEDFQLDENMIFPVIFCPQCDLILNTTDDVRITYIHEADTPKYTNWRLTDELS